MNVRTRWSWSVVVLLSACGGGGGGGGEPPPPANAAPTIAVPAGLGGAAPRYTFSLTPTGSQTLQFQATDPDGDSLQWTVASDAAATTAGVRYTSPFAGDTFLLEIDPAASAVASKVTIVVEDPRGGAAAIDVLVVRSGPPTITDVTPSSVFAGRPQQVEVVGTALRLGGAVNTNIRFDGVSGSDVVVESDTKARCTTPTVLASGPTIVSVENAFGSASLLGSEFTAFQYPPVYATAEPRLDLAGADAADVVLDGTNAHAVWIEGGAVMHRRSTDGGAVWLPGQSLSGAETPSEPLVLANGDAVLVAWIGNGLAINLRRSTDGGVTFAAVQRVDAATGATLGALRGCLAGARRHLAWISGSAAGGTARVIVTSSGDGGAVWTTPVNPDNGGANQGDPSIAAVGANVYVVCTDDRTGATSRGIYALRSGDGGGNWQPAKRLSLAGIVSTSPRLAALGSRVHVVWLQGPSLFYGGSIDSGATWTSSPTEVRNGAATALTEPAIACSADRVYVAHVQSGTTVWVSRLAGAGALVSHTQIDGTATTLADGQVRVAANGAYVFVAWRNGAVGDGSARVLTAVSADLGVTFSAAANVTTATAAQDRPALAVDGARMLLGWLDSRDTPTIGLRVNRNVP